MTSNNGWYSIHDTEHIPESGKEYLCLAALYDNTDAENPLADPDNRVYFVATWYDAGDVYRNEIPDRDEADDIFGKPVIAEKSGFYITEPELRKRKNTKGGKLPPFCICQEWHRLDPMGEGLDNLICWKELDAPEL